MRDARHDYVAVGFREDITDEKGNKLDVYTTPITVLMKNLKRMQKEQKRKKQAAKKESEVGK